MGYNHGSRLGQISLPSSACVVKLRTCVFQDVRGGGGSEERDLIFANGSAGLLRARTARVHGLLLRRVSAHASLECHLRLLILLASRLIAIVFRFENTATMNF